MSFITDNQLKTKVAGALRQVVGNLDSYWDEHVSDANAAAYQDIVGTLVARGFTKAQVDDWDRGAEFQTDIGLFWALTKGAALDSFNDKWIDKIDRRNELKTVSVFIDGEWVKPINTANGPGMIGSGAMNTDNDMFIPFDPDDGRIGEPTRW